MRELLAGLFSYPFIQRALIAGTLVALCSALLGVSLVLKRYSMIGDGLSHVGFGAMAVAMALGAAPLAVALPVVQCGACHRCCRHLSFQRQQCRCDELSVRQYSHHDCR